MAARRGVEVEFFRFLNRWLEPQIRAGLGSPRLAPGGLIVLETLGRKTGRGWYEYGKDGAAIPFPEKSFSGEKPQNVWIVPELELKGDLKVPRRFGRLPHPRQEGRILTMDIGRPMVAWVGAGERLTIPRVSLGKPARLP